MMSPNQSRGERIVLFESFKCPKTRNYGKVKRGKPTKKQPNGTVSFCAYVIATLASPHSSILDSVHDHDMSAQRLTTPIISNPSVTTSSPGNPASAASDASPNDFIDIIRRRAKFLTVLAIPLLLEVCKRKRRLIQLLRFMHISIHYIDIRPDNHSERPASYCLISQPSGPADLDWDRFYTHSHSFLAPLRKHS